MSSLSRELAALGPLFQVRETLVVQTSAQAEKTLCGSDARRWALIISPPGSQSANWSVSTVLGNVTAGGGIRLEQSGGTFPPLFRNLELNFRDNGTLVQQSFVGGIINGTLPSGNATWTVIEILLLN